MPTYDYVCDSCGYEFELFQSMTAPVKRKCPQCGNKSLRRLIGTGAGVIFKGGGFYETDYRSDSYKKAAKADQPSSDGGDGGSKKKDGASGSSGSSDSSKSSGGDAGSGSKAASSDAKSSGGKGGGGSSSAKKKD